MKKASKATTKAVKGKTLVKPSTKKATAKTAVVKAAAKPAKKLAKAAAPKQSVAPKQSAAKSNTKVAENKPVKEAQKALQAVTQKVKSKIAALAEKVSVVTGKEKKETKPAKAETKKAQKPEVKVEIKAEVEPSRPKTLREALNGTIKRAQDMEPEAILAATEAQEQTDAEKKALARKLTAAGTNFESVFKLAKNMKPKSYKMSEGFDAKTAIMHKVLGWGFVLTSENNRIQVLFKDGVKTLITNYQSK